MGKFLEHEKRYLVEWKATSASIEDSARGPGVYKQHARPFCLPRDYAAQNLVPEIRHGIRAYFDRHAIKWHDGQHGNPSNHLCDSQVCCANFLFPFAHRPGQLATMLSPVYPDIKSMLAIEDGQFVACEWIGKENYLGEKLPRHGIRMRGALFTSADAAVMFERQDGRRQIVLIEWKYTESYYPTSLVIAASGTDRRDIYRHLFEAPDCPLDKARLASCASYDALFFEPFYQLMRQQFLAHKMEQARELGADVVSLLHIAPRRNVEFRRVTSEKLRPLGASAVDVWKALVRADRFASISTEDLIGPLLAAPLPEMQAWQAYIAARYPWVAAT